MNRFQSFTFLVFSFLTSSLNGQQLYSANKVMYCNGTDETGPSPTFLYTCNGAKQSCPTFLIFRAQPPYNSVTTISKLTSSDPSELARINNISRSAILSQDQEVIIPVTCSCFGQYYQANTSYVIRNDDDTYFTIATRTYEGLSTCDSLMSENIYDKLNLSNGLKLQVPLRCACPTVNQTMDGTKFLLTYLITWKDTIPKLGKRFNVSNQSIASANGFSEEHPNMYPFTTILLPLPDEPTISQMRLPFHKRESKKGISIGLGIGTLFGILCVIVFVVLWKRSKTERGGKRKSALPAHILAGIAGVDQVWKVYEFHELEEATKNFSLQNILSDNVYRGVLRGKVVAIKNTCTDVSKEVKILSKINHFNLISLYGACQHDRDSYLVYEFMENGSLREWLRKENCLELGSWSYRINIAFDAAKGLQYLHNFTYPAYVHKDINSSNILLNRDLRAKISNFSLARSVERDEHGNSSISLPLESKGYLAPECSEAILVTTKMDVYAFGVVLLELITGREAVCKQDGKDILLSEAVLSAIDKRNAKDEMNNLVDPRLHVKHPLGFIIDQSEVAIRLVKLSVACLEIVPSRRLSMVEVVNTLMTIQMDAQRLELYVE